MLEGLALAVEVLERSIIVSGSDGQASIMAQLVDADARVPPAKTVPFRGCSECCSA